MNPVTVLWVTEIISKDWVRAEGRHISAPQNTEVVEEPPAGGNAVEHLAYLHPLLGKLDSLIPTVTALNLSSWCARRRPLRR